MRPNPPYLATVVIAIVVMLIGLSLEGSLFSIGALNQVVADGLAVVGIKTTQDLAHILIVASPTLLIIGSLVRGSHWAPKAGTVVLAAVLTVFAALVFFTNLLPGTIAGFATGTLALYAAIAALVALLLGVFVKDV